MKRNSLLAAIAIMVGANAVVLAHAWFNRTGAPDAIVTLTNEELTDWNSGDPNSGLSFNLLWTGWDPDPESRAWATRRNLESLGFDYSVAAESSEAPDFYRRQQPRRAFVALEIVHGRTDPLRVIDVARDPVGLRVRHPNPTGILILPAVVAIEATPLRRARPGAPGAPAQITARITELPTRIHVPRPFSAELRRRKSGRNKTPFSLHLNYGRSWEPWVTGLDFPANR